VSLIQEQIGAPVVLMGFGLPDDAAHAPNEKLRLANFYRGIRAGSYFVAELRSLAEQ
jgi:acetylornithine deacetylase/succinyl-diaminopimelate desuccinylase-like protein